MDEFTVHPHVTQREQEILQLVAHGYSAKEIAAKLHIAPRTVERHTENVRLKLRARNRAHLITLSILEGYLNVGPAGKDSACEDCLFRTPLRAAPDPDLPFIEPMMPPEH